VDVGRLLAEAVDEPGVAGVIDTRHTTGGVPDMRRITGGIGGGRNRLAVLYGSTADRPAVGPRFTATLTTVLREGLPDAARRLHITSSPRGRGGGWRPTSTCSRCEVGHPHDGPFPPTVTMVRSPSSPGRLSTHR
jgi:hypothetical protein